MVCKGCLKETDDLEDYHFLQYMGTFCTKCAIRALTYWKKYLDKQLKEIKQNRTYDAKELLKSAKKV